MPKYALLRSFPPAMTRAQLNAKTLANMATLETYIYRGGSEPTHAPHDIKWIRSYWEPGGYWGMCLYEAPNMAVLRDFQFLCGAPFIEGHEVEELGNCDSTLEVPEGQAKVAVTLQLRDEETEPNQALEAITHDSHERGADGPCAEWVRAYWNPDTRRATALYVTDEPEGLQETLATLADSKPATIVEVYPEEYQ